MITEGDVLRAGVANKEDAEVLLARIVVARRLLEELRADIRASDFVGGNVLGRTLATRIDRCLDFL